MLQRLKTNSKFRYFLAVINLLGAATGLVLLVISLVRGWSWEDPLVAAAVFALSVSLLATAISEILDLQSDK